MKLEDIKSGADYAQLLINNILEGEKLAPTDEQLPINLLTYWCEEIETYADKTWIDYVSGKREHFSFEENEFRELFEKAGMRYSGDILNSLVDEEYVDVLVRDDGEIVYKTNEKGKQALEDYDNQNKDEDE